jgi:hypothetical protein
MTDEKTASKLGRGLSIAGGLPGLDRNPNVVPDTTDDFVTELCAVGIEVAAPSPDIERLTLRAGDIWLPILVFGSEVGATAVGELVAQAVMRFVRRRRAEHQSIHLRVERRSPTEEVLIDVDGPAVQVVEALRQLK